MAIKLSDLILTSDVDGTLLDAPNPIPPRNVEAIKRFTEKGGRFAIASGRSIESARIYADQLAVNAPCIVFNGSGIYDYQSEKLLYADYLPNTFEGYANRIMEEYPTAGAILLADKMMYTLSDPENLKLYLEKQDHLYLDVYSNQLKGPFFKIIFAMLPETAIEAELFAKAQEWEDVSFVRSSPYFMEMLPFGVNKGTGLVHLAKSIGVPITHTVSIGDFYNDVEMLKTSGFSATVQDAPEDIKLHCQFVAGHCMDGAVADLIEHLEATFPME